MTAFSFSARLHLGANSDLALSLPQSRCFNPFSPRQLPPQREPRRLPPQGTDLALLSKLGANAITGRGYNPSVKPLKAKRLDSSPYTGEPRFALSLPCRAQREARVLRSVLNACSKAPRRAQAPQKPMLKRFITYLSAGFRRFRRRRKEPRQAYPGLRRPWRSRGGRRRCPPP